MAGYRSVFGLRWTIYLQLICLFGDLILTLFAEQARNTFFIVAVCYTLQGLLFLVNVVFLFVNFTATYPFKAGALRMMATEFSTVLICSGIYFIIFLIFRIPGAMALSACDLKSCDFWTTQYITLFILFRIAAIGYYVSFQQALVKLCDIKYYQDNEWLRGRLNNKIAY